MLAGYFKCCFVIAFHDEALEACRAGNVGALADVYKQGVAGDIARLQPGQAALLVNIRHFSWWVLTDSFDNGPDVVWRGATTPADDIQKAIGSPVTEFSSNFPGCFIVFAKLVWQPCIWMCGNACISNARQFLNILTQLVGAKGTIETDGNRFSMT